MVCGAFCEVGVEREIAKTMNVVTIILNWNGKQDSLECLKSLLNIKHPGWSHQILVVDNGSNDGSTEAIKKDFPQVTLIENQENKGFAVANNQALEWGRKNGMNLAILLNNDTVVTREAFDLLVKQAKENNQVGAVVPVIRYYNSSQVWYAGGKFIRPFGRVEAMRRVISSKPYPVEIFSGCCVLIPMKVLSEASLLFDERYFLYLEDTDLSLRLGQKGYKIWLVPQAVVYHKVSRSSGGNKAPDPIYYQVRNNLLLTRDYSKNLFEYLLGLLYMTALSVKIWLNLFLYGLPNKKAVSLSLFQAWRDFMSLRWGKRR